jgi:hypothetical protein
MLNKFYVTQEKRHICLWIRINLLSYPYKPSHSQHVHEYCKCWGASVVVHDLNIWKTFRFVMQVRVGYACKGLHIHSCVRIFTYIPTYIHTYVCVHTYVWKYKCEDSFFAVFNGEIVLKRYFCVRFLRLYVIHLHCMQLTTTMRFDASCDFDLRDGQGIMCDSQGTVFLRSCGGWNCQQHEPTSNFRESQVQKHAMTEAVAHLAKLGAAVSRKALLFPAIKEAGPRFAYLGALSSPELENLPQTCFTQKTYPCREGLECDEANTWSGGGQKGHHGLKMPS